MEMQKKKIHLLLFGLFIILCLVPCKGIQASAENEYTIDSYDVDIDVNEDNVLEITETIQVNFLTEKHGIVRDIPRVNNITRQDGSSSSIRAKISDVRCSDPNTMSTGSKYYSIRLGEEDKVITGPYTYTIQYFYDLGRDTLDGEDEFYFNIIGPEWDTTISQTTFSIHMPKKFDEELIGFSSGAVGTTGADEVYYYVDGRNIIGDCYTTLNPGDALTVRLTLPEGYFIRTETETFMFSYIVVGISLLFLAIGLIIWFFFGRNSRVQMTTEYYPPKELNSAEVGYIYHGKANTKAILSLILDLARKGYLRIEEAKETVLFKEQDTFRIYPEKATYDGNKRIEAMIYSAILRSKNGKDYLTKDDLDRYFSRSISNIKKRLESKENASAVFTPGYMGRRILLYAMMIVDFFLITYEPMVDYSGSPINLLSCLFPILGISVICFMIFGDMPLFIRCFILIWGILFSVFPWYGMILPAVMLEQRYIITYIIGIICCVILFILSNFMHKRTASGNEIYWKIKSFRHFLQTIDQSRLEALELENPEYYSEILPYAYALGVKSIQAKELKLIPTRMPSWYVGHSHHFPSHRFYRFLDATSTYVDGTSGSSGGHHSSGGGGSSGGGAGGGGGHSW